MTEDDRPTRKPHSPETKAKIAAALRGKAQTPEHVAKRASALTGRLVGFKFRAKMKEIADAKHPLQGMARIPPPPHWRNPKTDTHRTYRPFFVPTHEKRPKTLVLTADQWEDLEAMLEAIKPYKKGEESEFHELAITFPHSGGAVIWGWKLFRSEVKGYARPGRNGGNLNLGGVWMYMRQATVDIYLPSRQTRVVECFRSPLNLHPHDRNRRELVTGKTIPEWYTLEGQDPTKK